MLILAISSFGIAAILGLILISRVLTNKNTPKGLALIHGFFAALGILLLILYMSVYSSQPYLSLIFFILAALGGFTMFYRDITGKSIPKWLAVGHGLLAVSGFVILLVYILFI